MSIVEDTNRYSINLTFEEIGFPPFHDVLVVGKDNVHGKLGLSKCFEYMIPNGFKMIEVTDDAVEAVFINYKILKKIPEEKVINILRKNIFPFLSPGELLKVNMDVKVSLAAIKGEI